MPAAPRSTGRSCVDATHFYLSFAANTSLPGLGPVEDEDIVAFADGTWSVWFNGTAHGLAAAGQDIDAFSLRDGATAP